MLIVQECFAHSLPAQSEIKWEFLECFPMGWKSGKKLIKWNMLRTFIQHIYNWKKIIIELKKSSLNEQTKYFVLNECIKVVLSQNDCIVINEVLWSMNWIYNALIGGIKNQIW